MSFENTNGLPKNKNAGNNSNVNNNLIKPNYVIWMTILIVHKIVELDVIDVSLFNFYNHIKIWHYSTNFINIIQLHNYNLHNVECSLVAGNVTLKRKGTCLRIFPVPAFSKLFTRQSRRIWNIVTNCLHALLIMLHHSLHLHQHYTFLLFYFKHFLYFHFYYENTCT